MKAIIYDFSDMDDPMAAPKVSMGVIETKVEGGGRSLLERLSIGGIEEREAAARITELEERLKEAQETIADLRNLAYERQPKIAAEEANRQKAELEAQLAEAKAQWASPVYARLEKAEADAAGARAEVDRRRADVEAIVEEVNKYKSATWATMRTTLGAAAQRISLGIAEALQARWKEDEAALAAEQADDEKGVKG
jgi:TolA-binding protein